MAKSIRARQLLKYAAFLAGAAVVLYLAWVASQGLGSAGLCAAMALLSFIFYMISFTRSDVRAERMIVRRIRVEFPAESQTEILTLYQRLKAKELEYLFVKVLDDAQGNVGEVRKLAGLAESLGWKAFLEDHW